MSRDRTRLGLGAALAGLLCLIAFGSDAPARAAEETARFELWIEITWSAERAPLDFPEGAHTSRLIGATHNSRYVLFRDGDTASSGLELLAENGRVSILEAELAEAKRRRRVGTVIEGSGLARVPDALTIDFETSPDHPRLSFATMIAPSPDWFAGAADVALMENGDWIEEATLPLWAWDAGTDAGESYAAPNADSQPRESVRLLATPHVLTRDGLVPIGVARLRRLTP